MTPAGSGAFAATCGLPRRTPEPGDARSLRLAGLVVLLALTLAGWSPDRRVLSIGRPARKRPIGRVGSGASSRRSIRERSARPIRPATRRRVSAGRPTVASPRSGSTRPVGPVSSRSASTARTAASSRQMFGDVEPVDRHVVVRFAVPRDRGDARRDRAHPRSSMSRPGGQGGHAPPGSSPTIRSGRRMRAGSRSRPRLKRARSVRHPNRRHRDARRRRRPSRPRVRGPDTWSPDGSGSISTPAIRTRAMCSAPMSRAASASSSRETFHAYATASSPDGTRIAFIVDATYGYDLWVAESDGATPV